MSVCLFCCAPGRAHPHGTIFTGKKTISFLEKSLKMTYIFLSEVMCGDNSAPTGSSFFDRRSGYAEGKMQKGVFWKESVFKSKGCAVIAKLVP